MSKELNYTGYYQELTGDYDAELACVGRGTPCGEYMRRFWHPVAIAYQVKDVPLPVTRFGEDLILFRTKEGDYGLVHKQCCHRNASLEFGIITNCGIRCCYHGWEYGVDGTLLAAPAEPAEEQVKKKVRLGAYPTREYKGLIFAYLGPPEEIPPFPEYDTCEIEGGEIIPYEVTQPCNWLQIAENSMDPYHVVFLHTRVNIVQFTEKLGIFPIMDWRERPTGFFYTKARRMDDMIWMNCNDIILPNFTQAGAVYESTDGENSKYFGRGTFTRWVVPVDDENTTILALRHFNSRAEQPRDEWRTPESLERIDIGEPKDRPYEERQRNPGDYEAFVGQGRISPHKREQLAWTDRGVVMYRNRLRKEIRALQNGTPPASAAALYRNPIPTFGSDTVLYAPLPEGRDDQEFMAELQKKAGDIYEQADSLKGDARYDFLAEHLSKLEQERPHDA